MSVRASRLSLATVPRLESGRGMPSTRTLERYAKVAGTQLTISFEPVSHPAGQNPFIRIFRRT
jgi:transcriptional regulator with XRE-family HTH domain